jgi:hypothetical protein
MAPLNRWMVGARKNPPVLPGDSYAGRRIEPLNKFVEIDCSKIQSFEDFHTVFYRRHGLPGFLRKENERMDRQHDVGRLP